MCLGVPGQIVKIGERLFNLPQWMYVAYNVM